MKRIVVLLLLLIPIVVFSQDSIFLKDGSEISAKVLKIKTDEIEYKKASNIDGPLYSIETSKVLLVKFENGEKEVFSSSSGSTNSDSQNTKTHQISLTTNDSDAVLKQLGKQDNIVYVESEDDGAGVHAIRLLKAWDFWRVTPDKEDADLILKFVGRYDGPGNWSTYLQFINPINDKIIKTTQEYSEFWGWSVNKKEAAIETLIEKELRNKFY